MCQRNFCNFPWWLKMWKVGQNSPFFKWAPFWNLVSKKRKQLHFSEINYLNYTKKDPILHVTTTFSLKQGETRTSSGPIPHLLTVMEHFGFVTVNSVETDITVCAVSKLGYSRWILPFQIMGLSWFFDHTDYDTGWFWSWFYQLFGLGPFLCPFHKKLIIWEKTSLFLFVLFCFVLFCFLNR